MREIRQHEINFVINHTNCLEKNAGILFAKSKILLYYSCFMFINVILNITQKAGFLFGDHKVGVLPVDSDLLHCLDLKRMPGRNEIQGNYLRDTL